MDGSAKCPSTMTGVATVVPAIPAVGRRCRSSLSVAEIQRAAAGHAERAGIQPQRAQRADAVLAVHAHGGASQRAHPGLAGKLAQLGLVQQLRHHDCPEACVDLAFHDRRAHRAIQRGGDRVRRVSGTAQVGPQFKRSAGVAGLVNRRQQRLQRQRRAPAASESLGGTAWAWRRPSPSHPPGRPAHPA